MRILPCVVGAATVVGLVTGLFTINDRYVTKLELKAYAQSVDTKLEFDRQQRLTEQYYQMKSLQRKYPKDEQLKEDVQAVMQQREASKQVLDKLNSTQKEK